MSEVNPVASPLTFALNIPEVHLEVKSKVTVSPIGSTSIEPSSITIAQEHAGISKVSVAVPVSYTHLRAHETVLDIVCRLLLEKKKNK